nr:MAG TPA: restriction alleviation protein [Caudoviricetes sp.]
MSEIKLKPCPFCGGEARIASESETVVQNAGTGR